MASSMEHASRQNRHWPYIASVRSTTPGVAPMSLPRCSSPTTGPRRHRGPSKSSLEPSCPVVPGGSGLGLKSTFGSLALTCQLGDDLQLSTVDRQASPEPAHSRTSMLVGSSSLHPQHRPCGRPGGRPRPERLDITHLQVLPTRCGNRPSDSNLNDSKQGQLSPSLLGGP